MSLTTSPPRSTRSTTPLAQLAADPVWPHFGPIPSASSGDDVPPKPVYSTLICINNRVARAGIEPATFRFSVTHFTAGQTADLTQHAPGVPIAHDFTTIVLGSSSASPRAANRLNSSATFRSRPSTTCRYRIAATDDE